MVFAFKDGDVVVVRIGHRKTPGILLPCARGTREAEMGAAAARRDYLTGEGMTRLLEGEAPVKVWREKRGLTQRALAQASGVNVNYLCEIETGKKRGSAEALRKLAGALEMPMEMLVPMPIGE